jgi:transglutaminase-like putative cysteine protease
VRIPSVGPGARIVRARLGLGADDLGFRVFRDGADNWFLQPSSQSQPGVRAASMRARLVMEIAVPRAAFGGPVGDPSWGDLLVVPPLPDNVAREAAVVSAALRVSRAMRPRAAVAKLVQYFRGFADSDDPPEGRGSVYLDLALSKKGVCRHRAFAFLVTAQSLGIPTRVVMNEAHAWVEVHDGALWRRIDLGGAGRMTSPAPSADRAPYAPLPDLFAWPRGAVRGDDMIAEARARGGGSPSGSPAGGAAGAASSSATAKAATPTAPTSINSSSGLAAADDRPSTTVSLSVMASDAHRGQPLPVRGTVRADGDPCPHVAVEVLLRDPTTRKTVLLGTLATGDDGSFAGGVVVPGSTALGDYDVVARTRSDTRYCGAAGAGAF